MAAPLAGAALNVPTATRVTRSASTLRKQVEPSTPASASDHDRDHLDDDDAMDDEIVLAPLPTRTAATTDPALSSQTRLQLARPGSSALDDRVSDATGGLDGLEGAAGRQDGALSDEHDEDMRLQDEDDELEVDDEQDDEDEVASSSEHEQDSRSEGEIQAIGHEMDGVERSVPGLLGKYHLVDRLGEGASPSLFSLRRSLASLLLTASHCTQARSRRSTRRSTCTTSRSTTRRGSRRPRRGGARSTWPSSASTSRARPAASTTSSRSFTTCGASRSPSRLHARLRARADPLPLSRPRSGARNVAYLVDAIRHEDQVVAVMPFNRHQDFRVRRRSAHRPHGHR